MNRLLAQLIVISLEVDEPVAHLGVVGSAARLQLYHHVVHHHNLLAGHGLVEKGVFVVLEVSFLLLKVGKAHRVVLLRAERWLRLVARPTVLLRSLLVLELTVHLLILLLALRWMELIVSV